MQAFLWDEVVKLTGAAGAAGLKAELAARHLSSPHSAGNPTSTALSVRLHHAHPAPPHPPHAHGPEPVTTGPEGPAAAAADSDAAAAARPLPVSARGCGPSLVGSRLCVLM